MEGERERDSSYPLHWQVICLAATLTTVATRTLGLRLYQVETDSLLRPEAPYAQLNGVLERLSDLGYYSPEDKALETLELGMNQRELCHIWIYIYISFN